MKSDNELHASGFTPSGAKRFLETITAYGDILFDTSIALASAHKARDSSLEVTHENVRAAAHHITTTYGKEKPPGWIVPAQIGEYVCTATAGIGAGNIGDSWGIFVFGVSVAVALVLFVLRNNAQRK